MELTNSFESLLFTFAPVFTEPSFATFRLLMTGWILSLRHRYVTDLIISSDSVGNGHFSDYHRFFSQAAWDLDQLWKLLAQLIVATLIGPEGTIVLAGDDTLCRRGGTGEFVKSG
jgi:DDE superfamily endonuclease